MSEETLCGRHVSCRAFFVHPSRLLSPAMIRYPLCPHPLPSQSLCHEPLPSAMIIYPPKASPAIILYPLKASCRAFFAHPSRLLSPAMILHPLFAIRIWMPLGIPWVALTHPGVELRANLKSISHRCYLFEVAFVWELTKETIHLPLGCLQGGPWVALTTLGLLRAQGWA